MYCCRCPDYAHWWYYDYQLICDECGRLCLQDNNSILHKKSDSSDPRNSTSGHPHNE